MMKVGDKVHGFTITDVQEIPEYRSTGILATHDTTGAQVFHTHNEDPENLFAYIFKTIPESSHGVAHILEHTVLCGSRSFPVKDPFLLLLKGSMQTFLNAFTYPDKTVYPASSTVEKDLFNLMEVYGDAVFFPLLKSDLFRQEGHRLELDAQGGLVRTGIVYNEMKGNYSTHDSVAGDWCYRTLFPDTPYQYDSGGDPKVIPQLEYEEFKMFHTTYYHPTNTLVYLYGNIPTQRYLEFIQNRFFQHFEPIKPLDPVSLQSRWDRARTMEISYPAGQEDREETHSSVTLNWMLFPVEDTKRLLSWEILTEILMGSPSSPLQKLAAVSELGEDLSSTSGFETELRQTVFSVGLQGADRAKAEEIQEMFLRELRRVVSDGLNPELVEGTLRRFEFRNREIKGGGPFGLRLLRKIGRGWLHGIHPAKTLVFSPLMKDLRTALLQNTRYFEQLIQEDLLDNPHRSTVIVYPDGQQNTRETAEEAQSLQDILDSVPPAEQEAFKQKVAREQKALEEFQSLQDDPEDLAKIPFLNVSDIPKKVEVIQTRKEVISRNLPLYIHDLYTNGITSIDGVFSFEHLTKEQQLLLPLWTSFVPVAGIPGKDYEQLSRDLSLVSGGFSTYPEVHAGLDLLAGARSLADKQPAHLQGPVRQGTVHKHLFFRLKALDTTISEALSYIAPMLTQPDFTDLTHLAEVFFELRNDVRSSILPGGSSYAVLRAELGLHPAHGVDERLRGLTQYLFLENLARSIHRDKKNGSKKTLEELSQCLTDLGVSLVSRSNLRLNITAQDDAVTSARTHLESFLTGLPEELPENKAGVTDGVKEAAGEAMGHLALPNPLTRMELLEYPSKVAYVGAAVPAAGFGTPEQAQESLLAHILKTGPLWEEIRMKGGAYGAHASSDGMAGIFTFASYRDPQTAKTLARFSQALADLETNGVDQRTLDLAKIGCISKEQKPLSPGEKGIVGFKRALYGIEDHLRQHRRDLMLSIDKKDVEKASSRLVDSMKWARKAILSGPELLDAFEQGIDLSKEEAPVRKNISR